MSASLEWFSKAANQGHSLAAKNYKILSESLNKPEDEESGKKEVEWYKKAANSGDTDAMIMLADFYMKGKIVEQSFEKGVQWIQKAWEGGSSVAGVNLAFCFLNGRGVEKNEEKAIEILRKAGEGNAIAQFSLGIIFYEKSDFVQAKNLFERAADNGHAEACAYLGELLLEGKGTEKDVGRALSCFKTSAMKDNPVGKYWMGRVVLEGFHLERKVQVGRKYLIESAEEEFAPAAFLLFESYLDEHMGRNEEEAMKWAEFASNLEHGEAMLVLAKYHLGNSNLFSQHFERDPKKAKILLEKCVQMGIEEAKNLLKEFDGK